MQAGNKPAIFLHLWDTILPKDCYICLRGVVNSFEEESMKRQFWLVTTEHLENSLWFKNEDDFKAAMNYVAVLAYLLHLKVVAFVLMSNHVHFVLECSWEEAMEFITRFKKNYSQYYSKKYSHSGLLSRNGVDVREVHIGDESFERAVAYVHMNPVAANICLNSTQYQWGTGSVFFNACSIDGTRVGDIGVRELIRIIHSKTVIPPDWILGSGGYILPQSYVPVQWVESVFRTPRRMIAISRYLFSVNLVLQNWMSPSPLNSCVS